MYPRRGIRPWRRIAGVSACVFAFALAAAALHAGEAASTIEQRLIELYQEHASAVVRVIAIIAEPDEPAKQTTQLVSSGFFISREGRVLTHTGENNLIARAIRIYVEKDGLPYLAELVGTDPQTSVALLQVVKLPARFSVMPVTTPEEKPVIGSLLLSITSPVGLDPSPSLGMVAGYESSFAGHQFPFTFMRVTIPVGPGEHGSPVSDFQGHLVGIIVAGISDVRSSYLVPTRALARIVEDLSATGHVNYGALPLELAELPDALNVEIQVTVTRVRPESAAARAGVRVGDVVRRLGSVPVKRIRDVRDALFFARSGQFIQMEVEREGRRIEFALPVEARADPTAPTGNFPPPPPPGADSAAPSASPPESKSPTPAPQIEPGPSKKQQQLEPEDVKRGSPES